MGIDSGIVVVERITDETLWALALRKIEAKFKNDHFFCRPTSYYPSNYVSAQQVASAVEKSSGLIKGISLIVASFSHDYALHVPQEVSTILFITTLHIHVLRLDLFN